jgi:Glyoxalase-like domain
LLELDHVFCMVSDPGQLAGRLEEDGWILDDGRRHRGQGTRNRRLVWAEQFLELLWVIDAAEATANPLRLDRRSDWGTTGASPFGLGFRGQIDPADSSEFWLYDALGPRIWIHRDNERFPERPLIFVLETGADEMKQRRPRGRISGAVAPRQPGDLCEVRVHGPSAPSLPPFVGPPIAYVPGPHLLELVLGDQDRSQPVSDAFAFVW